MRFEKQLNNIGKNVIVLIGKIESPSWIVQSAISIKEAAGPEGPLARREVMNMAADNQKQESQTPKTSDQKSGMPVMAIVIIVVVLLGAGAYYFYSQRTGSSTVPDTTMNETQDQQETTQEVPVDPGTEEMVVDEEESMEEDSTTEGEVREISVEGEEYDFSPSSITVSEGETVRIAFTNVGTFPHNFVIEELGVSTETIQPGESDTVEFTADESGTFAFYCSVGNHRAQGMEGDLEVE